MTEITEEYGRPVGGYLRIMAAYGGAVTAAVALAAFLGKKPPERVGVLDLFLMGVSTHRLSRTLAKDSVTSPLRAPFTRFKGVSGPAELKEEPRSAMGELLACPFCLAQWIATAYAAGLVFAPRMTRLAGSTMTAVAVSDWLQFGYAKLMKEAE
ncbi:DUF1360 domain-containing protein [Nonomuraea dietziae]|uniref:DUF1360 domain-containing protein n=1 Tax=Nonomuraea dietziae TaxID=65515 RepID=A0A7W5V5S0_9ACTN|nr:DUF1360 domain-containing protein [Nonomuraea dietziae]MBB3731116.1 hypothetical protein [Nonomuraea dietziae]